MLRKRLVLAIKGALVRAKKQEGHLKRPGYELTSARPCGWNVCVCVHVHARTCARLRTHTTRYREAICNLKNNLIYWDVHWSKQVEC